MKIILDLCGGTGSWSKPYKDAGYDVRLVTTPEHDVRSYTPPSDVYGVLAAPPCTHFSVSGAQYWYYSLIGKKGAAKRWKASSDNVGKKVCLHDLYYSDWFSGALKSPILMEQFRVFRCEECQEDISDLYLYSCRRS